MIHIFPPIYSTPCVRIEGDNLPATIDRMKTAWDGVTSFPFSYQFLDSTYDAMYKTERSTGKVIQRSPD